MRKGYESQENNTFEYNNATRNVQPRLHRTKKNSPKKWYRILWILVIAIILLFIGLVILQVYQNTIQMDASLFREHNLGTETYLSESSPTIHIDVQYPSMESGMIQQEISTHIADVVSKFKQNPPTKAIPKPTLVITYRSFQINKDIGVIQFDIVENGNAFIEVYHVDTLNDQILTKEQIFKTSTDATLLELVKSKFQEKDELKQYVDTVDTKNYMLTHNGVIFYIQNLDISHDLDHTPQILISYKDLSKVLQSGIEIPTIVSNKQEIILPKEVVTTDVTPVNTAKPMIALTFDDGPHATYTQEILNALKTHGGAATFFVLGNRASQYPNVLQSIVSSGSEIGNHSWDHKNLANLSVAGIHQEINDTINTISKATNYKCKLVRPPYGAINATVKSTVNYPLILWNVDTLDWKTKNTDMIVQEALKNAKDGNIILMHDIYPTTKDAALKIIEQLTQKGFQLVTISQMYQAKKVPLTAGKSYTNI